MNQPIYHTDITQGTDEWMSIRQGKVGGSSSAALFVKGKSADGLGAGAYTLAYEKAAEIMGLSAWEESWQGNEATERGNELEPFARQWYERTKFIQVTELGYITRDWLFGTSPDGLVGTDGMIEIKCPSGKEFIRVAETAKIKPEYISQMQWGLWITGRAWCDHLTFHPDAKVQSLIRIHRDEAIMAMLDEKTEAFRQLVLDILTRQGYTGQIG